MDRLHALILILHAKTARDGFPLQYAIKRNEPMTPNIRGAAGAVAKLRHNADERAKQLIDRVESVDAKNAAAHTNAHGLLDQVEAATAEIEGLSQDLEGTNGGPSLQDGSEQPSEPHKSWVGDKQG